MIEHLITVIDTEQTDVNQNKSKQEVIKTQSPKYFTNI